MNLKNLKRIVDSYSSISDIPQHLIKYINSTDSQKESMKDGLIKMYGSKEELEQTITEAQSTINAHESELARSKKESIERRKQQLKEKRKNAWDTKKYQKYLEMFLPQDGEEVEDDYARDMAENAQYEDGLIDFVKRKIEREGGREKPLQRIQWDIEALM